jgi:hypothetical protein
MRGDLALLSLATHRYLRLDAESGAVTADHPGPRRGKPDGSRFVLDAGAAGGGA